MGEGARLRARARDQQPRGVQLGRQARFYRRVLRHQVQRPQDGMACRGSSYALLSGFKARNLSLRPVTPLRQQRICQGSERPLSLRLISTLVLFARARACWLSTYARPTPIMCTCQE